MSQDRNLKAIGCLTFARRAIDRTIEATLDMSATMSTEDDDGPGFAVGDHIRNAREELAHAERFLNAKPAADGPDERSWVITMCLRGTKKVVYLCTNPTLPGADDITEGLGNAEVFYQVAEAEAQIERIGQYNWTSVYECRYVTMAAAKKIAGE